MYLLSYTNLSKWLRLIKTLDFGSRSDLKQFEMEETLQFKRVNGFICFLLLFDLMFLFHARYDGMTLPTQILCGALSFHTRWSNRHTFCPVALATWQSSKCPKKSKLWGVESLGIFVACIKKSSCRFWSILFQNAFGSFTVFPPKMFCCSQNPQIWVPNFVGSKADIHGHPLQKFDLPKDCVSGHLLLQRPVGFLKKLLVKM